MKFWQLIFNTALVIEHGITIARKKVRLIKDKKSIFLLPLKKNSSKIFSKDVMKKPKPFS